MDILRMIWHRAKREKSVRIGPVSFVYRFRRSVFQSTNILKNLVSLFRYTSKDNNINLDSVQKFPRNVDEPLRILSNPETAVIVGVGPGLGYAVARKLAKVGMSVALVSRNVDRLDSLVNELRAGLNVKSNALVRAYGCDATSEQSVDKVLSLVVKEMGTPLLVVYAVQGWTPGRFIDVEVAAFEESWRQNCLGGFVVARDVARRMLPLGRGTIILIGSPSAIAGRAAHLNLAVGKFGLRALAQVMSRELWQAGIHVAHLIIDGDIDEGSSSQPDDPQSNPDDIADTIYMIHQQPKSAWTSEIDVRPFNEAFWEHC